MNTAAARELCDRLQTEPASPAWGPSPELFPGGITQGKVPGLRSYERSLRARHQCPSQGVLGNIRQY